MNSEEILPLTQWLHAAKHGDTQARQDLWDHAYPHLYRLAKAYMNSEKQGQTLSSTALVHEAYLKLDKQLINLNTEDRSHFFALACQMMRHILIDRARHKCRDIKQREMAQQPVVHCRAEDLLHIHDALSDLEKRDEKLGRVVECKFFGGMTNKETAIVLQVSERTVERYWLRAKTYLYRSLSPETERQQHES